MSYETKRESSSMYKVLNDEKSHTVVKSNVGDVRVDKNFMQREIKKHLDWRDYKRYANKAR